jgi:tetratricopeptide (TPR) repeat protein
MSRALLAGALAGALLAAPGARAQTARAPVRDADLGAKRSVAPDAALQGSLGGKKAAGPGGPALDFDTFRQKVEVQLSDKRREEIASLQKLIRLGGTAAETPGWYFRLAELLWEESQYFFFEAGRRDDRMIALGKGNPTELARLQAEKRDLEGQSLRLQDQALALYKAIVKQYPQYPRMDEVLFFLAENLSKRNRFDEDAMKAYRALVQRFPQSRYVPDCWMAFGEYYFEKANKLDRIGNLRKAMEAYKRAASYQESSVYGYAMYKQGWVHYNLGQWAEALDLFRAVIYFGELPTTSVPADRKIALVKEAKKDYVRTYSHVGSAEGAADEFRRVGGESGWMDMLKSLANLYFDEGKDRDAVVTYARLIREKPLSPEAPLFQSRIVTCAGRLGRKDAAVQQAHVFVKMLREIEAAAGKDEKGQKAIEDARRDAENTLRTLAVQYHNEWKKTRDEPVAGYAAAVYRDYLEVFPRAKTAYEMRFFYAELLYAQAEFQSAGVEYERVALEDVRAVEAKPPEKAGKFFKDALENAVFAYDLVAKKLDETEKRVPTDPSKRVPMVPQRQALLTACERYLKYQPKGDKWVEIAYKAANLYYRHNDFGPATDLFTRIALDHPQSELAGYSTNLVLDAYNLLGDWRNVNGWAKRFYGNAALVKAHPALRDDLARVIEQSAFKLIEEHERKRDYEAAAEAYVAFVRDWPGSKLAPTALYNASVDLGRANRLEEAVRVRDQLLARYPGDALVPKCVWDNAQAYEAIAEFDRSADYYERYFRSWKAGRGPAPAQGKKKKGEAPPPRTAAAYEEKKANDAIINVAVFRAGMRDWTRAEAASLAYLETWPAGADASRIFLSLADLYAKQGSPQKELRQLEEYQRRYAKDPDEWLAIQHRIALLLEKSGNAAGARRAYELGLAQYRKSPSRVKDRGMPIVAEAMLREIEPVFAEYARVDFNVRPKDLRYQLERKKKRLVDVQQRYAAVVKLKQAEPAVCALYRIALASSNFAQSLLEAPIPKEIRAQAEYVEEYRSQLQQAASPFEGDATQGAQLALQASRDYGIANDCSKKAEQLLARYQPDAVAGVLEPLPRIAAPAIPERPRAYGLVDVVQASPAPRTTATARRDDPALPPLRDPTASAPAPRAGDEPLPRPKKKGTGKDDDEDLLP